MVPSAPMTSGTKRGSEDTPESPKTLRRDGRGSPRSALLSASTAPTQVLNTPGTGGSFSCEATSIPSELGDAELGDDFLGSFHEEDKASVQLEGVEGVEAGETEGVGYPLHGEEAGEVGEVGEAEVDEVGEVGEAEVGEAEVGEVGEVGEVDEAGKAGHVHGEPEPEAFLDVIVGEGGGSPPPGEETPGDVESMAKQQRIRKSIMETSLLTPVGHGDSHRAQANLRTLFPQQRQFVITDPTVLSMVEDPSSPIRMDQGTIPVPAGVTLADVEKFNAAMMALAFPGLGFSDRFSSVTDYVCPGSDVVLKKFLVDPLAFKSIERVFNACRGAAMPVPSAKELVTLALLACECFASDNHRHHAEQVPGGWLSGADKLRWNEIKKACEERTNALLTLRNVEVALKLLRGGFPHEDKPATGVVPSWILLERDSINQGHSGLVEHIEGVRSFWLEKIEKSKNPYAHGDGHGDGRWCRWGLGCVSMQERITPTWVLDAPSKFGDLPSVIPDECVACRDMLRVRFVNI